MEGGRSTFFSENKTYQKFIQTLVWDNGGLKILFQIFFDLIFLENLFIFNTFCNSGAPSGQVGPESTALTADSW